MRLASMLGMSVARTKQEVSSGEFTRWIAEWSLEASEAEHAAKEAELRRR